MPVAELGATELSPMHMICTCQEPGPDNRSLCGAPCPNTQYFVPSDVLCSVCLDFFMRKHCEVCD